MLASLSPLGALLVRWIRERKVSPLLTAVAISALIGATLALLFRDARAIVYKDMTIDSLWAVVFLGLAAFPSEPLHQFAAPVAGWLLRGATRSDWNRPGVRATLRRLFLLGAVHSALLAASKGVCLHWYGLDGYLLSTMIFRWSLQAVTVPFSLIVLRRALR